MPTAAAQHTRLRSASDPFSDPVSYDSPSTKPVPPLPSHKDRRHDLVSPDPRPDSPRARMHRSHTQALNSPKPPITSRRTLSHDSAQARDSSAKPPKSRKKDAKSAHADAIDRLDFSGVGPALFHHDGPFDACAPSRNRHQNKAPMFAWGTESSRDDPMAAAARVVGRERRQTPQASSPYAFDDPVYNQPIEKKKVDAIAEAWGFHEPEPYEEFFSGGYSTNISGARSEFLNDNSNNNSRSGAGGASRRPTRTNVPPPQPVLIDVDSPILGSPGSAPKRSTSIMGRFRKTREAPMNEGGRDEGYESVAGRFKDLSTSPTSPETVDGFVNVQDPRYTKTLPVTPVGDTVSPSRGDDDGGYFEGSASPGGIGRKGSLLRRMKGAVRGGGR